MGCGASSESQEEGEKPGKDDGKKGAVRGCPACACAHSRAQAILSDNLRKALGLLLRLFLRHLPGYLVRVGRKPCGRQANSRPP